MALSRVDGTDACGTHHRWVCVDPVHDITDAPGACAVIATAAARSSSSGEGVVSAGQQRRTRATLQGTATARALAYVVGVDGLGDVSDVTRRYAPRWSEAVKLRIDSDAEQVTRSQTREVGLLSKRLITCVCCVRSSGGGHPRSNSSRLFQTPRAMIAAAAPTPQLISRQRVAAYLLAGTHRRRRNASSRRLPRSLSPHCPLGPMTFGAIRGLCSRASWAAMK